MKEVEKEGYTYLGIVELWKRMKWKTKQKRDSTAKASIDPKWKLNGKNKIAAINAWEAAAFKYWAEKLQWKESELIDVNWKSEELCGQTLHKEERERQRSLMSVERCVRKEKNSLSFYAATSSEYLIRGIAAAETINTEGTVTSR